MRTARPRCVIEFSRTVGGEQAAEHDLRGSFLGRQRRHDTLAEAHASLAIAIALYDWDWLNAEREFRRAIELKPTYATARHWYAFVYLTAFGRLDQAIAEEIQAQQLEPLSLIINTNLGTLLYLARQYDEAIDQYRKALEIDSNFMII